MCHAPNRPVMVGLNYSDHRAIVFRPDCEMWNCPECAEKLRGIWKAKIAYGTTALLESGSPMLFLTITSHEKLKTFAACHAVFPHAWGKLYAAMKRRTPTMAYALIPEKHKDGRMHVHLITDCRIKKRWLKDNARSRGFGYEADVKRVESVVHAVAYTAKYLGKGLGTEPLPPHFRRIRLSQNFPQNEDYVNQAVGYSWLCCRSTTALLSACAECQEKRLQMVDLATGELFDLADLLERIADDAQADD